MRSTKVIGWMSVGGLFLGSSIALADTTPQTLPFMQDWSDIGLITTANDWSGVPGIIGYRGDGLAGTSGATDPQTVLVDGSTTPVNVIANQTNPNTLTTGGVAEFHITNPVVALQGSGTARAPHIVITLDTTGKSNIKVEYNLRDIDGAIDNAIQPVALQYRVGTTGNYTNLPAGFVPDASTGPSLATLVTPVSVDLPVPAWNQSVVQIRVITTDAAGSDEWIGIDDIHIFENAGPDSDGDGVPDAIDNCPDVPNPDQADCDQDGIGDACDKINNDSDCDGFDDADDNCPNIFNPDQADCDLDGVGDVCQIAANPKLDCNENGILDSCELAQNDCNNNGLPDSCDILFGLSPDCNNNGVPDECETDCDNNGVPDSCQIASNPSLDTNLDGVLDLCQLIRPVIINEILADPANSLDGDANGDGVISTTQDEFIELVNQSASPLDVSGWTISVRNSAGNMVVRHTFALGTTIAPNCAAVVFGGGVPVGLFGGALVQVATNQAGLDLANTGDTIMLRDGKGTLITALTYGSNAGNDTSITRDPEATNGAPLVQHSSLGSLLFSPGRRSDGTLFGGCTLPPDTDGDGIPDATDNCPTTFNPNQSDCDEDGIGDACETDPDDNGNGVPDICEVAARLNEIRIDMPGEDCSEYVEIRGTPGTSLEDVTLLVIGDGTAGSGVIEMVLPLAGFSIPTNGHFLIAESTFALTGDVDLMLDATSCNSTALNLENSDNITIVLAKDFTGSNGQDLDTNDDGTLDVLPWAFVIDAVGVLETTSPPTGDQEWAYGASLGFEDVGPDGSFAPGHIYRCETAGDWMIGTFAISADDTPGASNSSCPAPPCPADTNNSGAVDVDDLIAVILGWGPCPPPPSPCPADTNDSGAVDVDDLIAVILGWGPCP